MNVNLGNMITQGSSSPLEQPSLADIRKVWYVFRRRWPILLGVTGVVLIATCIWLAITPAIYTATTTVIIDPRKTNAIKSDAIVSDFVLDANTIATEVSLIKSFSVARRVTERLKLQDDPHFAPQPSAFSVLGRVGRHVLQIGRATIQAGGRRCRSIHGRGLQSQSYSGRAWTLLRTSAPRSMSAVSRRPILSKSRTLIRTAGSRLKLANAVAESYLDEQIEARIQAAQRASKWLSNRVSELGMQLGASERALAEHRAKFNLAKQQDGTLADQQAVDINTQLVAARAQTWRRKPNTIRCGTSSTMAAALTALRPSMDSASTAALRLQEATVTREEANLLTRYGPQHPAILKIRAEHADINGRSSARSAGSWTCSRRIMSSP